MTHATVNPPDWKYCKECAKKLGIDYDKQTPESNLTEKELEHKCKLKERMRKANEIRLQKLNLRQQEQGTN